MMNRSPKDHTGAGCDRADDLISYLYGESDSASADDFARHLAACAVCRAEAAALGGVRADLALWRAQASLQGASIASAVLERIEADAAEARTHTPIPRRIPDAAEPRSLRRAWRSLGELLRVTPRWAQACAALVAFLTCSLAAVSLGGYALRTPADDSAAGIGKQNVAASETTPTSAELDALVEREVARRLALRNDRESAPAVAEAGDGVRPRITVVASDRGARVRPAVRRAEERERARARRPVSPADAFAGDPPRLSDLLSGAE